MKLKISLLIYFIASSIGFSQQLGEPIDNPLVAIYVGIDGRCCRVFRNQIETYNLRTENIQVRYNNWTVTGGEVLSSDTSSITVKWDGIGLSGVFEGAGSISCNVGYSIPGYGSGNSGSSKNIIIFEDEGFPESPLLPIITDQSCDAATLQMVDEIPNDVTWYWQGTDKNGRSTENSFSTFNVTSSGTYYLRAKRNNYNVWSETSTAIDVFLTGCETYTSTDENYIKSILFQKPFKKEQLQNVNTDDVIENITYFDALGRPKQAIAIQSSPLRKDIVTHMEYDMLGRQNKKYLPVSTNNENGFYLSEDMILKTKAYYKQHFPEDFENLSIAEVNAFTEEAYDNSPLNRVLKQSAPGEDWKMDNGHEIKYEYTTNNSLDSVYYYKANTVVESNLFVPTLVKDSFNQGLFASGELYKHIVKDENWTISDGVNRTTEEYKNKQGKTVLKRTYNNREKHDTYYIYDEFGNLTFVLPPKVEVKDGVSSNELDKLCYQYVYDQRNRITEKKIPGKGWEHIVYDCLDRIVMTQDAKQRNKTQKEWLFTKYDKFGRLAYTGMTKNNNTRKNIQEYIDAHPEEFKLYEEKVENPIEISGTTIYYTKQAYPLVMDVIYTINYYDDYAFDILNGTNPGVVYNQPITTNAKSLATGSKIRVLGTKKWITNVNYYDEEARLIYAYSYNEYLGTTNIISNQLDFTGKVLESTSSHKRFEPNPIIIKDKFTYDHMSRLLTQKQTINNQKEELIVSNVYDELGILSQKEVGGKIADSDELFVNEKSITITENREIYKNSSENKWDAGFATTKRIEGDGEFSFTPLQTDKSLMVGLSYFDTDVSHKTIDFGMYITTMNSVGVYEKGVYKGFFETYTTSDVLSVKREENTIYYQKNGVTFYTSKTSSTARLIGDVSFYHPNAGIKEVNLVGSDKQGLQVIDYTYNVRGWLKSINNPTYNLGDDLFAFRINYNTTDVLDSKALYNGNISETHWKTANDGIKRHYSYDYDNLNRLIKGIDNTGRYNLTDVSYDKNGNLLRLTRQGWQNGVSFANMDRLNYTYDDGNQLMKVIDTGNDNYGFKDGPNTQGIDYAYDVNGNMILDRNKGITNITYNHLNLPKTVTINGKQIRYTYDATGAKLTKSADGVYTHYNGGFVYKGSNLEFFNHPEGYVEPGTNGEFDYVYQYKDHLDNIRLSYSDANKDGLVTKEEIREENNYYPFGLKHKGYNNAVIGKDHKYGFGRKEEQEELGLDWIDITARNYDPALGRWMNIDPLAEQMRRHSPYNYGFDNPVYFMDPDGMKPLPVCPNCLPNGSSYVGGGLTKEYVYQTIEKKVVELYRQEVPKFMQSNVAILNAAEQAEVKNMLQGNLTLNEDGTSAVDLTVETSRVLTADDFIQIQYLGAQYDPSSLEIEGVDIVTITDSGASNTSISRTEAEKLGFSFGGKSGSDKSGKEGSVSGEKSGAKTITTTSSNGRSVTHKIENWYYKADILHTYKLKYINQGIFNGVTDSNPIIIRSNTRFSSSEELK